MPSSDIPYFILNLGHGKAKVLFTVPSHLAQALARHPILCRGSAFDLRVDDSTIQPSEDGENSNDTCFLATEFESPDPEETAIAISKRLASRVTDTCENPLAGILGLQR